MKYCTCCEKMRETHIRKSEPKWFWKYKPKEGSAQEYVREVCIKCQSPLLIPEAPAFDPHIKVSKKDKRAEKRHLQQMYRVTNWPEM